MNRAWGSLGAAWLLVGVGCTGGEVTDPDAGTPPACPMECDDGLFCNGVERCDPTDAAADAQGCVAAAPPCEATCDEDTDACGGCPTPDQDGDGQDSIACGGGDCDDEDPTRFPGNVETCDEEGHDDDCDPSTLGPDADADGYVSVDCCNASAGGELVCGQDCDDSLSGVNPGAPDGCGGGDQDCDGTIDEEPDSTFFRDQDSDNYGTDADTVEACSLPPGYSARGGDCSDDPFADPDANTIHPGVSEVCDSRDNDCDGGIDEGLTCDCMPPGIEEPCGFDPALDGIGICRLGTHMCRPEGSWTTCAGATPPATEACNLADDDCDGTVDEGVIARCWQDTDRDGYAPATAPTMETCACPDGWTTTDPSTAGADCAPDDPARYPGATEVCNRIDDDCSRGGGAENAEDSDGDGHTAIGFTGCTGGFPKDDCQDFYMDVHPGQTRYFTRTYCPLGSCGCGTGCADPDAFGRCPFCDPGSPGNYPGIYDYDCSGTTTRQPNGGTSCTCRVGFSCLGSFPSYSGSPACGSNVSWRHCGSGVCGSCSGARSNTSEPLGCR